MLEKEKPDLAIVDITLQGQNGLDLLKTIKSSYQKTKVLVVSMHEESLYGERAVKAGARGYVMKNSDPADLLAAVQTVLEGRIAVSEDLKDRLMGGLVGGTVVGDPVENLSDRELEVFRLIGKGYGATEAAEALRISVKTVNAYRENIKDKLNLPTAADLRKYAVEWMQSNF
jgi:DNA-binding NarL/FixJ family response regulator